MTDPAPTIEELKALVADHKTEAAVFAELLEDCNLAILEQYRAACRENARLRGILRLHGIDPDTAG